MPITFSHHPGCMFVADIKSEEVPTLLTTKRYPKPVVICMDELLDRYSTMSEQASILLDQIEKELYEDLGNRGIKHLTVAGDFHKACLSLSERATSVGIILGFPCFEDGDPLEENDGVAGAIYIARVLTYLNIDVTFFVDGHSDVLKETLHSCCSKGFITKEISVSDVGAKFSINDRSVLFDVSDKPKYSHLIAIERASPSQNGQYCTMKARDVSSNCDPLDKLFEQGKYFLTYKKFFKLIIWYFFIANSDCNCILFLQTTMYFTQRMEIM